MTRRSLSAGLPACCGALAYRIRESELGVDGATPGGELGPPAGFVGLSLGPCASEAILVLSCVPKNTLFKELVHSFVALNITGHALQSNTMS